MDGKIDLCTMGEVLLRLSEAENEVIARGTLLHKEAAGSEMNIAAGVSMMGLQTAFLSRLPRNDVGQFVMRSLRSYGVSEEYIQWDYSDEARLGVMYYENGVSPRKPRVVYDRGSTSFWGIGLPGEFSPSPSCFHTSGITLALCRNTSDTAEESMKQFKRAGSMISFDVNYRANLWSGDEARDHIEQILPLVDILFCSEDTARLTFGKKGTLPEIMKSFAREYPLKAVISTKRTVHSPKCHTFGSLIYVPEEECFYEEAPYERIDVVDRVGSGDAYVSGVLYGLLACSGDWKRAMEYGNAIGAVSHTLQGDLPALNAERIEAIIRDHQNTGFRTELDR